MENVSKMGMNKTGAQAAGDRSKDMADFAQRVPSQTDDMQKMFKIKEQYLNSAGSIGSVPMPRSVKEAAKVVFEKISGKDVEVFMDKLGERLAFERSGVRLYDSLIQKCRVSGHQGDLSTLERIRNEEAKHMAWVEKAILSLDADPTVQTPAADISAVTSMGVFQVVNDPRVGYKESLESILVAELADHAGWEMLVELAEDAGKAEMAESFKIALNEETRHLGDIKGLIHKAMGKPGAEKVS